MSDPTYDRKAINRKTTWKIAYLISEMTNDDAPVGWGRFIPVAEVIVAMIEREGI